MWKGHGYHLEMASLQRHKNVIAQSCPFFQSPLGVQRVTLIYAIGAVFHMEILFPWASHSRSLCDATLCDLVLHRFCSNKVLSLKDSSVNLPFRSNRVTLRESSDFKFIIFMLHRNMFTEYFLLVAFEES